MRIQLWTKLLKRKPIAGVLLAFVFVSAVLTVFRLTSVSHEEIGSRSSSKERSTSPVELSWPLPLSYKGESAAITNALKKSPVNDEQIKKLKIIYPM